jgi:hypothetical protein
VTSNDLCTHAGISYRQLDHWARKGYLGHAAQAHVGTGYTRDWTYTETAKVERMALLVKAGMGPAAAARIADTDQTALTCGRLVLAIEFRKAS